MQFERICAAYFSATGTTKKIVSAIADAFASRVERKREDFDFTLPKARETAFCFNADDLVIFGVPVYAGRVPNVLVKYLATIRGGGAVCVPVVVFGNRDYDDALVELKDILEGGGFRIAAAAAFVGEHSFSKTLAGGRPDEEDFALINAFADNVFEKIYAPGVQLSGIEVRGVPKPYRGYYQPRGRDGNTIDIRKVKPLTGSGCDNCMICANLCPMGSISRDNVREFTGICIKCNSCVKNCPQGARYFEDEGYLHHKRELEEGFTRRALPETFL